MNQGAAHTTQFKQGDILFSEGDTGGSLLIIKSGVVEVYRVREGMELVLATVGTGEILGAMTATSGKERTASVRARTNVIVQEIARDKVEKLVNSLPSWATLLINDLVLRVEQADQLFTSIALTGTAEPLQGRYISLARRVAEGFMPLAETMLPREENETLIVNEVLDKLAVILDTPFDDLRRVVDIFNAHGLSPLKGQYGDISHAKMSELGGLSEFGAFVKDALRRHSLEQYTHALAVGERKILHEMVEVAERLGKDPNEPVKLTFAIIESEILKMNAEVKFNPQALKVAERLKLIEIDRGGRSHSAIFVPTRLRRVLVYIETLVALNSVEDRDAKLQRKLTLVY